MSKLTTRKITCAAHTSDNLAGKRPGGFYTYAISWALFATRESQFKNKEMARDCFTTIERTFFAEFVYKKALSSLIGEGLEQGKNPRQLEKDQNVRLMNLFAEKFFIGQWNPTSGGRQVEARVRRGEEIPEAHPRAWRIAREEILGNVIQLVRLVISVPRVCQVLSAQRSYGSPLAPRNSKKCGHPPIQKNR